MRDAKAKVIARVALLVAANTAAAILGSRAVRAQVAQRLDTCSGTEECHCIIVDPDFGYCSHTGYEWEPTCRFQDDCRGVNS